MAAHPPHPTPTPQTQATPGRHRLSPSEILRKLSKKFRRHKYGVAPREERTADGIVFDSKRERQRYQCLKSLRDAGYVESFERQVPFELPGGVKYYLDFRVVWADGQVSFEDVKGYSTKVYRLKKRQVEAIYEIRIEEK